MSRILIPVDGSPVSLRVVDALVMHLSGLSGSHEVHLLNVQIPVKHDVGQFMNHAALRDFHRDEGLKALAEVRARLKGAGIVAIPHVLVDDMPALAIMRFAREHDVDEIMMGSHGHGAVAAMLLGSVARDVSREAGRPVTLID